MASIRAFSAYIRHFGYFGGRFKHYPRNHQILSSSGLQLEQLALFRIRATTGCLQWTGAGVQIYAMLLRVECGPVRSQLSVSRHAKTFVQPWSSSVIQQSLSCALSSLGTKGGPSSCRCRLETTGTQPFTLHQSSMQHCSSDVRIHFRLQECCTLNQQ